MYFWLCDISKTTTTTTSRPIDCNGVALPINNQSVTVGGITVTAINSYYLTQIPESVIVAGCQQIVVPTQTFWTSPGNWDLSPLTFVFSSPISEVVIGVAIYSLLGEDNSPTKFTANVNKRYGFYYIF